MIWQLTGIPDSQFVLVDADLNRSRDAVVPMDDGIEQRLAQRSVGYRIRFDALNTLIADRGFEILEA